MRLFIALSPDKEVTARLKHFIKESDRKIRSVRWTKIQNIHLTLKFLGEVKEAEVSAILEAMQGAIQDFSPFSFTLDKKGLFHNRGNTILWIGASQAPALCDLAGRVRESVKRFGDSKPFKPHMTVGRAKVKIYASLFDRILWEPVDYRVIQVELIKSELLPQGPQYTVLETFSLSHEATGN
jgi:2'-5' RNA ligase